MGMKSEKTAGAGITRRDMVLGAAGGSLAAAAALTPAGALAQAQAGADAPSPLPAVAGEPGGYYPPLRTGLRGSHAGSFEMAHALRDGEAIGESLAGPALEDYDLVIVGGGISGLSAAKFYRDRNPAARILILENHDDVGGHAKRNEFHIAGRVLLMNGGTAGIESPTPYSAVADGLLKAIGINVPALSKAHEEAASGEGESEGGGLGRAVFFDKETFGKDALLPMAEGKPLAQNLAAAPFSKTALAQIAALESGAFDPLAGIAKAKRKDFLSRISYRDYLLKHGRLGEEAIRYYQNRPLGWWCTGADAIPALDAWGSGMPGFAGTKLAEGGTIRMGYTPRGFASTGGSYDFHFPDGNATIARMLVKALVPGFMTAQTVEASLLAPCDYGALDRASNPVRIRLSSTAVRVANRAGAGADVVYLRDDKPVKVAARHVVMACWNMIIPYLVPELPEPQKAALHELVKGPLVYISVALNNWRAFAKAGVASVQCPGAWYSAFSLDRGTEMGGLSRARTPDEPALVHLIRIPTAFGLPEHDQDRAGRAELLDMPLATYETHVADLLERALGPFGFDAKRDIAAIAVNRWPHGYAPEYNALWDAKTDDDPQAPHVVGRARCGAIAIANSDAARAAYTDAAIDQAWRAVSELLG